jgi:uncharacterized protein (DUF885 family)
MRSWIVTAIPCEARASAAANPAGPAPMTIARAGPGRLAGALAPWLLGSGSVEIEEAFMGLVGKSLLGLPGLVAVAAGAAYIFFWAAPVGLDNYVNKVSLEMAMASPESFSEAGLVDNTLLDFHSGRMDDYTSAKEARDKALTVRIRAGLDKYGPKGLTGQQALTWRIFAETLDDDIRMARRAIPMDPYRVNQVSGVAIDGPMFLTDIHVVRNRTSAERYVKRVADFGRVLREVRARIEDDRKAGISPPDFIIDRTLENLRGFIADGAAKNILVTSFAGKLDALESLNAGERSKLLKDATAAVEQQVIPGYRGLIGLFEEMRPTAPHDAGVWRLPGGDAWYADRLRSQTTTTLTADEIHRIGLSEVARIEAEMTPILDARGIPAGEIGERLDRLMAEPGETFPNTDAGRAQVLAYLRQLQVNFEGKAKDWFLSVPKQELEIQRVPPYSEATAPGAYYMSPSVDGSRPGRFYINLRSTTDFPKWTLPTTFYHEGEPGHHFQLSAALAVKGVPIIRRVLTPTAYAEGWGLYAETLADEMGLYKDDPLGRLGKLQSEMFRAARLVVDTGIHARHWSREEAIAYMRAKTGMTVSDVTREVERYTVWPGQACAYTIGELTILRLRARAKAALGERFDIRQFHQQVIGNGGMPLDVLESVIDDWIAREGKGAAIPPAKSTDNSPAGASEPSMLRADGDKGWRAGVR